MMMDIDNHRLIYHPDRVAEWLKEGDCYPIYAEIGPTNKCNHKCIFCALDWIKHGNYDIDKDIMLKTLEDMASQGVKSIMFAGEGEPLLHKDISDFVIKTKETGIDVSITTNGVLFDNEKAENCLPYLSWIRFSIDAGTAENYSKIHQTKEKDFDKVIRNIENTVKIRNKKALETTIGAQYLLIPQNIKEVLRFAEIMGGTGADNIQIKPYSRHPNSKNKFVINYEDYANLETELNKLNSEDFKVFFRRKAMQRLQDKGDYNYCYGLPFFTLIDAKGNIIPCNLFYENKEFSYGNLYKQSFNEIWKGERRKEVLEKLKRKGVQGCREGCRLDPPNRYLHRLKSPQPHDNFI